MNDYNNLIDFFIKIDTLKRTVRYSSCSDIVKESTADHSWKLTFMASILNEKIKDINPYHAIKLCLVHDLAEYITGDIDSFRITNKEITKDQKYKDEEKAISTIKNDFPEIGKEIYNLWKEYQENKTQESKYVKALDKLESLTHILSVNYILIKDELRAKHTAIYADKAVKDFPQLKPILENIKKRLKEEYIKQGLDWKEEYN